jgi:hypothetical protein
MPQMSKEKYFIFMDETGNNLEENYFWLGILIIPLSKIWKIYDEVWRYYDIAKDIAKSNKLNKINEFIDKWEFEFLKNITSSSVDFELKSKNINFTNRDIYKSLIDRYFVYQDLKFSSLIIDKNNWKDEFSSWDLYINRASMLIANNICFIEDNKFYPSWDYILVADHITKPKWVEESFEETITRKVKNRLTTKWKDINIFFWATRQESHSSVLLQLVDILLWNTVYFLKERDWKIWEKSKEKKWYVANFLKEKLWNPNMLETFTVYKPNYFSIWYYKEK